MSIHVLYAFYHFDNNTTMCIVHVSFKKNLSNIKTLENLSGLLALKWIFSPTAMIFKRFYKVFIVIHRQLHSQMGRLCPNRKRENSL